MSCDDLAARESAALVKECGTSDDCAVTIVYGCCAISTGIRKDRKGDFEAAQAAYGAACPNSRGCGCADSTETGDSTAPTQPPVVVVATCDLGQCTAHVQK
jgi:hypothetical protein